MTRQNGPRGPASPPAPHAALVAGLAMGLPGAALAQGTYASAADSTITTLPTIDVEAQQPPNTLQRSTNIGRLPGSVQDTPQTINVIPREVLEQQNVTTLEQALQNVPGITMSAGEGNGGVAGDQFRIRGFAAQNDIYVDGLRDFGAYQRDAFTYEDVSVLKGPSGFALGSGSVGGGIAIGTRLPHLGNSYGGVVTGGMGPYARGTLDLNQQIGETTAMRLNLMGQASRQVDRRDLDKQAWGIAPSIAFGLGTDTTFSLHYLHYEYDKAADGGIPMVAPPGGTVLRPMNEYGLRRGQWYGFDSDRDEVTVDTVTARLSHTANDWLTLSNDTRFSYIDRDFAYSVPSCATGGGLSCVDAFFNRDPRGTVTIGGSGNPYHQESWAIQNVAQATARFATGPLRHELIVGLDVSYEDFERTGYNIVGTRPASPIFGSNADISLDRGSRNYNRTAGITTYAGFINERLWLTPEISIIGGVRVARYEMDYDTVTYATDARTSLNADNTTVDPRASLVWEPTPSQTYYFTYSTSTTPPGFLFTTQPGTANANNAGLDPERNTLFELGAKVGFFNNRLGTYASLYRIDKDNATQSEPDGSLIASSDKQRNQGIEVGITGQVTPAWTINANYTAMDSETRESTTPANVGKRVQYAPKNAASLWTTYEFNKDGPWNLTLGGGMTWRDQVYTNAANTAELPANLVFDAVISHRINDNLRLQVNGYNLGDALNYDAAFNTRAIPSPGRTVLFSLAADF